MLPAIQPHYQELLEKILVAGNQDEVKNQIDEFMDLLQQMGTDEEKMKRILLEIQTHLDQCNPFHYDAQQWSNIKMADIYCFEIHQSISGIHYSS
ncbi:MAG: hypothetical protein GTN67_00805 [Hydrotalea flava]|uniref:hypothetical protein n=1 Tax=Hydrotalea TaxID=1004300 RepID=UPI00094372ED|nr:MULTISPECIES: hypothetical protein [Hydrotalea]MBY0347900.1 hypothetical protein [Hydrotalea flava]NIM34038.1 hypothetical protein [Hydrotalea flava]NIM36867.1 hypothetical protein [Hydrotalea flava]NIN02053.1 hypothetical protein [Hydrotalea flava]NIN13711.1 hypothetical protein [Hydrotalea flava]